jgi:arginyl-tRNA synthetase
MRANYQGDVGLHVAKAIWGYRNFKNESNMSEIARWGAAYRYGSQQYEVSEDTKAAINALGQEIFADSSKIPEYAQGRTLSLGHFEDLYAILGTKFDFYFFESETGPRGLEIVKAHMDVFEKSDDAIIFKGEDHGLHTRVFINRLGLPTYEAKDLGLIQLKAEKAAFDTSITITAQEQMEYFKVVKKAMELIFPELAEKVLHISHGMMRFADGKMSSRTGNVITGESLLKELIEGAKERATESRAENHDELAEQIAVAAIKYQILKQGSGKNIVFDREKALSMEGDSGPYLQYTFARTCAIAGKARESGVAASIQPDAVPNDVTRLLMRFPEIVTHAAGELEPHLVTQYLLHLAAAFNSWYAQEQILDGTPAAPHKVAVVEAVSRTLKNGLWILGIPAPERM